jgi:DNA replication protein DnaC
MKDLVHARVVDNLARLRLGHVAERIDAILSEAAKKDSTYLDFLDGLLAEELASKERKRIATHVQIAHFPAVKTLDDFDFKFQPNLDQKLVRELATGRYIANAGNVLLFGPPGVGKTHLAVALGSSMPSSRTSRSRSSSSSTSSATCRSRSAPRISSSSSSRAATSAGAC